MSMQIENHHVRVQSVAKTPVHFHFHFIFLPQTHLKKKKKLTKVIHGHYKKLKLLEILRVNSKSPSSLPLCP